MKHGDPVTDHLSKDMIGEERISRSVRATIWNGLGAAVCEVVELATMAVVVRRVGVASFGVVVLLQGILQWPLILESGLGQSVVRAIGAGRRTERLPAVLASAFVLYVALALATLAGGLVVSSALLAPVFHIPRPLLAGAQAVGALLSISAALRVVTMFATRSLVGEGRLAALRGAQLLRAVVTMACMASLVGEGSAGLVGVGWSFVVGDAVAAVIAFAFAHQSEGRAEIVAVRPSDFTYHWPTIRPVIASSSLSLLWTRADAIIVAVALGPVATATYGVVVWLYRLLESGMELLALVLMPLAASISSPADGERVAMHAARLTRVMALVVWPLAAVIAVYWHEVADLWLHRELPGGVGAVAAAMALVVVTTPSLVAYYLISGGGRVGAVLRLQCVGAAVTCALSILLVRPLGVAAVFVGSVAGGLVVTSGYVRVAAAVTHGYPMDAVGALRKPAVLVLGLSAALVAVRATLAPGATTVAAVGVVMAVYAALALVGERGGRAAPLAATPA